jgi:thiosulfate reductase/polysulfide reductase chain A
LSQSSVIGKLSRRQVLKWTAALAAASLVGSQNGKYAPLPRAVALQPQAMPTTPRYNSTPRPGEKMTRCVCGMGNACGPHLMDVYTYNGAITRVEGTLDCPENYGTLCAKGASALQMIYNPKRILYPMKRVGERGSGEWQRISWEQAYSEIAAKLTEIIDKYTGGSVMIKTGHGSGTNSVNGVSQSVWGSQIGPMGDHAACYNTGYFGMRYTIGQLAHFHAEEEDYEESKLVVMWSHSSETFPMETAPIFDLKAKGKLKVLTVDPLCSVTAQKADLWLQPRPGTDAALALGMINVIINEDLYDHDFVSRYTLGFDQLAERAKTYTPEYAEQVTGVPKDLIAEAARMFAKTKPAVTEFGRGSNHYGPLTGFQAARAVCSMIGLCGQIGHPGDGVSFERVGASTGLASSRGPVAYKDHTPQPGRLTYSQLYGEKSPPVPKDELEKYGNMPLKAIIRAGGGILDAKPDYTFLRERLKNMLELLVCFNYYISATEEIADYLLPLASFAERVSVKGWGAGWGASGYAGDAAIPPLGECKSDNLIWKELGLAMGWDPSLFPWSDDKAAADFLVKPLGVTWSELYDLPEGLRGPFSWNARGYVQDKDLKFDTGASSSTASADAPKAGCTNKVEFYSAVLDGMGLDPLPGQIENFQSPVSTPDIAKDYPLIGVTGVRRVTQYNQFFNGYQDNHWITELEPMAAKPSVIINPSKAKELGFQDGDTVWCETTTGKHQLNVATRNWVTPDVVILPNGSFPKVYEIFSKIVEGMRLDIDDPDVGKPSYSGNLVKLYK